MEHGTNGLPDVRASGDHAEWYATDFGELIGYCFDGMFAYSTGTVLETVRGFGWMENGTFRTYDYPTASDGFESLTLGTITSVTGGTGWGSAGTFATYT